MRTEEYPLPTMVTDPILLITRVLFSITTWVLEAWSLVRLMYKLRYVELGVKLDC